jgi:hypothetical protein
MAAAARPLLVGGWLLIGLGIGRTLLASVRDEGVNAAGIVPGVAIGFGLISVGAYALMAGRFVRLRQLWWVAYPTVLTILVVSSVALLASADAGLPSFVRGNRGLIGLIVVTGYFAVVVTVGYLVVFRRHTRWDGLPIMSRLFTDGGSETRFAAVDYRPPDRMTARDRRQGERLSLSEVDVDLVVGIGDADDCAEPIGLAGAAVLTPLKLLPDLVGVVDADDHHVAVRRAVEGLARGLELLEGGRDRGGAALGAGRLDPLGN